jgi:hypothetical protein
LTAPIGPHANVVWGPISVRDSGLAATSLRGISTSIAAGHLLVE